jgi:hypothetical protein
MKKPFEDDQSLRKILRGWKVNSTLPLRFQEQVWGRIGKSETQLAPGWWTSVRRWLEMALARPALAAAYLTVLLLIGVGVGFQQGQSKTERAKSELPARYIQMVDPYKVPR